MRLLELSFRKTLYPYHLREICRTLRWSPTKVRFTLERLKRQGKELLNNLINGFIVKGYLKVF